MKKIFALGPEGTYGHQAALAALGLLPDDFNTGDIELLESHQQVFKVVGSASPEQGRVGIVAIENAIGEKVREVLDFWHNDPPDSLRVIGEVFLPIHHRLMVRPGTALPDIDKVFSHVQAISQCTRHLEFLGLKATAVSSTAKAAQMVSESDTPIAAIASDLASEIYGLEIIDSDLADKPNNVTRFHVVATGGRTRPTGNDRTAILFHVQDSPGSLVQALAAIGSQNVNMSSIHSITLGTMGRYMFYCEFDCHEDDVYGRLIFPELRSCSKRLRVLGSYPQAQKPE